MELQEKVEQPLLRSPARRQILDLLARRPGDGLTAAELAESLELHVTTLRFHLEQLVEAGLLTTSFVKGPGAGRPSKRYALHANHEHDPAPAHPYRELAELLAHSYPRSPQDFHSAEDAGQRWAAHHAPSETPTQALTAGAWLSKVGSLVDRLRNWGYVPRIHTSKAGRTVEVSLAACPYSALAKEHPEIVCAAHVGLLRGELESLGEIEAEVELTPFVEPGLCLARLSTRAKFTSGGRR